DLAAALELDLSTVSRQLRQLVDAGLVDRDPDPLDGRASLVSLSDRGRQVLDAVRAARREVLRRTVQGWLPEDRARLAESVAHLAADIRGGAGR
ncbi:MAG: MarR family winged helix-turn-helix transcriptional regulator, partial [Acidimicrobiales bacterium]